MILTLLVIAVLWLAWSNGANDNFKGVATLYGSRTTAYRGALTWATIGTVAGSLVSVFMANALVKTFSGHRLIASDVMTDAMLASIGLAAAATVALATVLDMPTSTTHALTGSLVGAVVIVDSAGISVPALRHKFARPLLLSPVIAIALTEMLYLVLHQLRRRTGIASETCICVGDARPAPIPVGVSVHAAAPDSGGGSVLIDVRMGSTSACMDRYAGRVVGMDGQTAVDGKHYQSATAVCFAREVNDTPKITAVLLTAGAFGGLTNRSSGLGDGHVRRGCWVLSLDLPPAKHDLWYYAHCDTTLVWLG